MSGDLVERRPILAPPSVTFVVFMLERIVEGLREYAERLEVVEGEIVGEDDPAVR